MRAFVGLWSPTRGSRDGIRQTNASTSRDWTHNMRCRLRHGIGRHRKSETLHAARYCRRRLPSRKCLAQIVIQWAWLHHPTRVMTNEKEHEQEMDTNLHGTSYPSGAQTPSSYLSPIASSSPRPSSPPPSSQSAQSPSPRRASHTTVRPAIPAHPPALVPRSYY